MLFDHRLNYKWSERKSHEVNMGNRSYLYAQKARSHDPKDAADSEEEQLVHCRPLFFDLFL